MACSHTRSRASGVRSPGCSRLEHAARVSLSHLVLFRSTATFRGIGSYAVPKMVLCSCEDLLDQASVLVAWRLGALKTAKAQKSQAEAEDSEEGSELLSDVKEAM